MAVKLLLMPGMDGSGELFRDFLEALPEGADVEIFRYSPHAWTSYRDLAATLSVALPDGAFVIVAESYSVPLAVRLAAIRPRGLRGVVLCAGFCTSPLRGWRRWMLERMAQMIAHVSPPDWALRWLLLGDQPPGGLLEAVKAAVSWVEPGVMASRMREVLRCDVLRELGQVRVPVLYVRATQDRIVSAECLREMLGVRPARAVAIDGPHLLIQREPRLAAEVVMAFVRELG